MLTHLPDDAEMAQEELAKKAKVAGSYGALIKAGRKSPSLEILKRLTRALGVPVTELLE